MCFINYYEVLGCTQDSTLEDIKRAYHSLVLKFHPDKNISNFDSAKFQHILKAWHVLRDPKSREEYDALQKQQELDLESTLVYTRIRVDELKPTADNEDILVYRCRCGGIYSIQKEDIEKENQTIYIPCLECTFFIAVQT